MKYIGIRKKMTSQIAPGPEQPVGDKALAKGFSRALLLHGDQPEMISWNASVTSWMSASLPGGSRSG